MLKVEQSPKSGSRGAARRKPEKADNTGPSGHPLFRSSGLPSGRPLDATTREFMESRMDQDFSRVRIHTDSHAAAVSESLGARAFTYGRHIAFAEGQYDPGSREGRRMLAHELVHTVQQGNQATTRGLVQRDPQVIGSGPIAGFDLGERISLLTPDNPASPGLSIIPDLLDTATLAVGLTLGRPLTGPERGILSPVFGGFLDYSLIRICENDVCSPDGVPRTIGNLIAAPASGMGTSTLIHEAAHIWQHQNGIRYGYIASALVHQFGAWIITGSRNAAYDWHMYYDNNVPWIVWNAEAQASYIEDQRSLPPWYVWGTGGLLPVP